MEPVPHRIRRKPAPSLHMLEKYPPMDPADPFASLVDLRLRSSAMLADASQENLNVGPSYTLYPDVAPNSLEDVAAPLQLPPTRRECHYRRRSQSVAHLPPLDAPALVRDSSTDSNTSDEPTSPPPITSTSSKFARLLLPRKSSLASINSATNTRSRARKISVSSISGPALIASNVALPPKLQFLVPPDSQGILSHLVALDSTRPMQAFDVRDAGFVSEPESYIKSAPNTLRNRRSSLIPTPTSSTQSHSSSSYINVSTTSLADDAASRSTTAHSYRFPFRRTTKSSTPSSVHHAQSHSSPSSIFESTQSEWEIPSQSQMMKASALPVVSESGIRVPFGSLFANQRTVVIFLRHFWCPLCQDYMASLHSLVDENLLHAGEQRIEMVIVSNGSHTLIAKYRQIFGSDLRYKMYTDPELNVYRALGMKTEACPAVKEKGKDVGSYVKRGAVGGVAMVVLRTLRVGMPVWERGGEIKQLGGEFVFGPGPQCTYAHRMQTPRGHAPIYDVLSAAGILLPVNPLPSPSKRGHQVITKAAPKTKVATSVSVPTDLSACYSDSEAAFIRRRRPTRAAMPSPQVLCSSATWDELTSETAKSSKNKRHSLGFVSFPFVTTPNTTSASVDKKVATVAGGSLGRTMSLKVDITLNGASDGVPLSVKAEQGRPEEDDDLVVLFEDIGARRADWARAYA